MGRDLGQFATPVASVCAQVDILPGA
jgi:hypothetical protein